MATTSTNDPFTTAQYADQRQKISDSYQIGLADNQQKKQQADLSWQDRIQQLAQQLGIQRQQFGDRFAERGLLNSGIYSYNGPDADLSRGQGGALQQFTYDATRQNQAATLQKSAVDNQYLAQNKELQNTYTNEGNTLQNEENAQGGMATTNYGIANVLGGAAAPTGANGLPVADAVRNSISGSLAGALS